MHISKETLFPPELKTPEGEQLQEILGLQAGNVKSHSLARVLITPGNASQAHYHWKSEESYLILSGTATLNINGQVYRLNPGEAVLIEPHEVHKISNQGDEDLIFLAVCVPAWHQDDSFDVDEDVDTP